MSKQNKWFVAEAVFRATIQGRDETWKPLVEKLLFLVNDIDQKSAALKAVRIANAKEHSYSNADGELVTWTFVELVEVTEMIDQSVRDGSEIKSWMTGGQTLNRNAGERA